MIMTDLGKRHVDCQTSKRMSHERLNRAIVTMNMLDKIAVYHCGYLFAGTSAMSRGIKSQHLVPFVYKWIYILVKIYGRGFKTMNDHGFPVCALIPPVT